MYLAFTLTAFIVFLVSLFLFIWRGCDRQGRMQRSGPLFIVLAVTSLAVWLFCLPRVPPPYDLSELKDYVWAK